MAVSTVDRARTSGTPAGRATGRGPLGRLGLWNARHFRLLLVIWAVVAVGLGAFAPRVEGALAGAGWEASGSQSVQARDVVQRQFGGLSSAALQVVVHADGGLATGRGADVVRRATALLRADHRLSTVVPPAPGVSLSRDGRTGVVQAGAATTDTNEMVRAADDLKGPLQELGGQGVTVALTGSSGLWSDFNQANLTAMLKSELFSWPVTLTIMVLAFGSLVAAGLPLMLTILGLIASAGTLFLGAQIADISVWALNFALMFALALGIDYALFLVVRFRAARAQGLPPDEATALTMDTAGKAVLFSGVTVLVSLSAVLLVPSPAFRSMALGIMLSVVFILAATLTLLPAVLARLGDRVNALSVPGITAGAHRSARFAAWGERLWRRPVRHGAVALVALVALALPVLGLHTGMPSIKVVPTGDSSRTGYGLVQDAFGKGAPGTLQVVTSPADAPRVAAAAGGDPGVSRVFPAMPGADGTTTLVQVVPASDASSPATGELIDRLRKGLPRGTLVGGTAAENHDLERLLADKTPLVVGIVVTLGFLLLLVALQAPLLAAMGVLTNLLAAAAAFGAAKLVFQDGIGSGLLGFEPQGFLDAWAPVFFFAMIFAIGMDYTVFLLASAKEHWETSGDPKEAMVGGLAHSGRVIFAAAGVMVAVFFTFALSGPLPPKEMGVVLGIAVLLDAALIRLLLLPVLMRLTGRAAWASPGWLRKVLPDIRFSH
jgi:putative drug exporter of the RND superfamily